MKTTEKPTTVRFTKEDKRMIEELQIALGENTAQILKRALSYLYFSHASARQSMKDIFGEQK